MLTCLANTAEIKQLLRSGVKVDAKQPQAISFARTKKLVSQAIDGREPGEVMRMHRSKSHTGYDRYHIGLAYTDAPTTIEIIQCRSVVSLQISFPRKADIQPMVLPLKLMLRSWAKSLVRLEIGVPNTAFYADILSDCREELAFLPNLKFLTTRRVIFRDDDVSAVCKNTNLELLSISGCRDLTDKALRTIKKLDLLKSVGISDSKITETQCFRFKKARPNTGLSLDGYPYEL
ncbi:hypothetical protein Enr13x_73340 [Stieleria neptunia]|uniref:Leucine Rich repeats (2 copies) n=1 Tax=Stieleria neptunia TaxID=2527979 RepID=A0A518I2U1_9BACT|nr:hypothetical protein Enr13x_73340 [Stieleria neptunia]